MAKWTSTLTPPKKEGFYLCSVECDDGEETHVLQWNGRHWIHEGEATFHHGYFFRPYAWTKPPAPADRSAFPSND